MFSYYLKLGALSIRANPALSALMVLAIAIGIGACMTIVTVRHVMSDNPIEHKNDVLYHVQVDSWSPAEPYQDPDKPPEQMTYLDAKALYDAGKAHRQVTIYKTSRVVQPEGDDARPFQLDARATTADFFPMFDVPFLYGAPWDQASDDAEERVTVLSKELNEQLFGGEDSTGRMLTVNGEEYRVSGVLDEWTPVPKFYDLNNNPYEAPEALYLPFSLAATNGFGRSGNTSCSRNSSHPNASGSRCGSNCATNRKRTPTCSFSMRMPRSKRPWGAFRGPSITVSIRHPNGSPTAKWSMTTSACY